MAAVASKRPVAVLREAPLSFGVKTQKKCEVSVTFFREKSSFKASQSIAKSAMFTIIPPKDVFKIFVNVKIGEKSFPVASLAAPFKESISSFQVNSYDDAGHGCPSGFQTFQKFEISGLTELAEAKEDQKS